MDGRKENSKRGLPIKREDEADGTSARTKAVADQTDLAA